MKVVERLHRCCLVLLVVGAATAGCSSALKAPGKPTEKLIVEVDADPDDGVAPLKVQFNCDAFEDIENPSYVWDFGDGSGEAKGQKPVHVYTKPGQYTVRVVVTNPTGGRGDDTTTIDVDEAEE